MPIYWKGNFQNAFNTISYYDKKRGGDKKELLQKCNSSCGVSDTTFEEDFIWTFPCVFGSSHGRGG